MRDASRLGAGDAAAAARWFADVEGLSLSLPLTLPRRPGVDRPAMLGSDARSRVTGAGAAGSGYNAGRGRMPTLEQDTRRFTVDDLRLMLEVGVVAEDEPVQLIEGRLVVVTPQGPEHSYVTAALAQRLRDTCSVGFLVREEKPITTGPDSQPEPDVAVVRGCLEDYATRHPTSSEVMLAVEVAHTSQVQDRAKAEIYARAGVSTYWLVDIPRRRVEVHTQPQPEGRFKLIQLLADDDELTPPGCEMSFTVDSLFPESVTGS